MFERPKKDKSAPVHNVSFFYILVSTCALELVSNADNFPKHEVGMATMSSHNLSSLYGLV